MKSRLKRLAAAMSAVVVGAASGMASFRQPEFTSDAAYGTGKNIAEYLDRGISAVSTGSGMLVSWRFLANDSDNAVFKLYRDNTLIYTSNAGDSTCYLDAGGSAASSYRVDTVEGGSVKSSDTCKMKSGANYFDVKLDQPTGSDCTYSPNDCSVGDVDGDGTYELFVKWDPSNSKDNSQKGNTGNVFIDCYRLDGTKLWRIDLGVNIRAGAHYTQFLVADFDCDGKAEMTCKTADGTKDAAGTVIGDGSKDYRNSSGYILSGPEYYTLFDGLTGTILDTVSYEYPRGEVTKSTWGDNYGNRCDRFLGAVVYCDGVHPSAVSVRGYYTRMTAVAYDVVNKKLVKRWGFDTGYNKAADGYGDGNHNCMPADVDNDGKQELVLGGTCLDDNGSVLWCTNMGHGDAMHLGDLLPDRNGQELWICHEESPYGVTLLDPANGKIIFHKDGSKDTGRCCADNVWAGNNGAEFWGLGNDVFDGSGNTLSCRRPAINFLSYWDGDLEREILDGYTDSPAKISKMKEDGTLTNLLSTDGYYTCNTTKGTPCLSADIFGDWREELVVRAADGKSVRIYATTYDTDYRITTLMHDIQYRTQVAGQNVSYNQPPHLSVYLGSDKPLPERPAVTINGSGTAGPVLKTGDTMDSTNKYMFKNVGSGLYLEVADGNAAAGANVQQGAEGETKANTWKLSPAGGGYYHVISCLGDGKTYYLDIDYGKTENGTNIQIFTDTAADAQLFKFVKNDDGTYTITTKPTLDASCLGVSGGSTEQGANVLQWECDGSDNQKWIAEKITIKDGITLDESKCYMFKNVGSQKYLEIEGGKQENGTNVQQWGADGPASHNVWHVKYVNWGYYYVYSALGDGQTFLLNVNGNAADGVNIDINEYNTYSSQYFKFVDNEDGTYTIVTRASRDLSAVAVADGSDASGANIEQRTLNGSDAQKWLIEEVDYQLPVITTTTTTVTTTTTTTTTTTAETTTTETTTDAGEIVWGDSNGDGKVGIDDVVKVMMYVSSKEANPLSEQALKNCDVYNNGDGVFIADALSIQKKVAQVIDTLPES
ncbi:MAG: RICIN domain-containing protein [Ruminococcus sp.]|nr:RICIN domain-containing protein [Ruminococcus sp.]